MKVLEENFRFMILEVVKQIENTLKFLNNPDSIRPEAIESRDDYIDNLKSVIENDCFSRIHRGSLDTRAVDRVRALNIVTSNLERLADHAVNIVRQTEHLSGLDFLHRYDYEPYFQEVLEALNRVNKALIGQDMAQAFKICKSEFTLDSMYKKEFERILNELRAGTDTGDLVTTLFIFRYLERMGDALLNMGEASIFAITGDKFKIRQYNALRETLNSKGWDLPISNVEFESIWGTRSGCRIGKVQKKDDDAGPPQSLIFKEGSRDKLLTEKANIERWEEIMPGLPPKVQALQEDASSVSLLIEYLGGCTFQDVVLSGEREVLDNAFFLITQTVADIWEHTRKDAPVAASYMRQALTRMPDVYRVHPEFKTETADICGMHVPGTECLLNAAEEICGRLEAPFSVFIHGDFNINNIVYNHEEQRIHYIDLHRSANADYVQDVSVFLVSNYRLPVFQKDGRKRIQEVVTRFFAFAREFAQRHDDDTFEARLCLGLARSFLTSTRFELNKRFAGKMFQRGNFLLQHILNHAARAPLADYRLPLDVLRS